MRQHAGRWCLLRCQHQAFVVMDGIDHALQLQGLQSLIQHFLHQHEFGQGLGHDVAALQAQPDHMVHVKLAARRPPWRADPSQAHHGGHGRHHDGQALTVAKEQCQGDKAPVLKLAATMADHELQTHFDNHQHRQRNAIEHAAGLRQTQQCSHSHDGQGGRSSQAQVVERQAHDQDADPVDAHQDAHEPVHLDRPRACR